MLLQDKVALVTGGTSGIGKAVAVALAQNGAKVVVAGRRVAEGQAVIEEVKSAGGEGRFVRADVAQEGDVKNLIAETVKHFGRLDIAFNNAGVDYVGQLADFTADDYRRIFDINVLGVFLSMKYEVPAMLQVGGGSIINTSSVLGHVGTLGMGIYVASKHAVEGITKTAALELAEQKIRVNAVAPAAIATDMIERFAKEGSEERRKLAASHPVKRVGQSQEVASAVVFLASDAASFITGTSLPVDGGWLAR
jgi:NAD(P)-dependent dehydrogenase (short-subunit alcohol dehydrogenase family)